MSFTSLQERLSKHPFFQFSGLQIKRNHGHEHTLLGFEPKLKNHIGTLHAGALFSAAHADALARIQHALETQGDWTITGFTSRINYKRPAKGPVWVQSTIQESDFHKGNATVIGSLNNESGETLAEITFEFSLSKVVQP